MNFNFKSLLPHLVAIFIFVIASSIYFLPQLQGKQLKKTDIIQYMGMSSEVKEYKKQGENILWTNSMFSGMPTFQISAAPKMNVSKYFDKLSHLFFARPIGYFLAGMLAFYFSFLLLGIDKWLSILGGLTFAFTTNNLILYEAGHMSKVSVLMISVLIIAGIIKVFRKEYIIGGLVFALGFAISLYNNHFQMTYYIGLIMGIYTLIGSIDFILKKDYTALSKALGILLLCSVIAIGTSASKIWTTYEYSKDTMRGKPILEKVENQAVAKTSSETKGLEWSYSMNWSNGLIDVMASYIPGVAGGGSSEQMDKNSATNKFMKKNRMNSIPYGPLYWGKLPFTSGPGYIGAVSIFLFFLSLFLLKGKTRWWAISAFLLTIMISMGKNLEIFNRLLFDYLPLFNKFRSPSSTTSITAIIVPFVGILGLNKIFTVNFSDELKDKYLKLVLYVAGALSVICLYYIVLGPSITDFETPGDARYAQQKGLAAAFQADRASLMRSDAIRSLLLTLSAAGVIFFFLKGKINKIVSICILAFLILFDLWGIDVRYIKHGDFVKEKKITQLLQKRTVDKQILKDSDIHYRVHDITASGGPFNSTTASLHHKTIGGYHAAKLQRYQDVIESHIASGNQKVFDMLNAKYFILGQAGKEEVRQNPNAYGNAWFVNDISYVNTNRAELESLSSIEPKTTAAIHNEFKDALNSKLPNGISSAGTIALKSYSPDKLIYNSSNSSDGLAIFSEVWYGPDKGWKIFIDGEETELIRADYILRAVAIPAGNHEITMEFKPRSFYLGETIGLISSILLVGGLIYGFWILYKSKDPIKLEAQ